LQLRRSDTGEPMNPPVIPEVEPRLAGRGETVRDLRQGMGARQIPDILDWVSDSGSCWKHASGMTGENFGCYAHSSNFL